ncbi:MAG: glycoside hydrolase family 9 protein [Prevotella sp.]|nr:glycoside hydrolase family 9 protein [Prevotella sp.]
MKKNKTFFAVIAMSIAITAQAQTFRLNADGYFNAGGTDVMAFSDFYPEGHQGGVCVIMNGLRIATNGDIRLEATPGQWQPVPKQLSRKTEGNRIITTLCYPDSSRHLTGFNPMVYPDWHVNYTVTVEPQGKGILVTVDLDTPVPDFLLGKVGFNFEFYPGYLFGKPWVMDQQSGIYPQQPNAPLLQVATNRGHDGDFFAGKGLKANLAQLDGKGYSPLRADDIIAEPYAVGTKFTSRPDDRNQKVTVESLTGLLKLYDGRMNHNNGWFVLRSEIAKGATKGAVRWMITPEVDSQWRYLPVIQTSQIGYLPQQQKHIVIETDKRDNTVEPLQVVRIDADGETVVRTIEPKVWGNFLRYRYLTADLSDMTKAGLYQLRYGNSQSSVFRIADNIYNRGVWQPVVEYFLPVQMCHMRVSEKYRIWHDACHMDDALMAKVGNHIDGYVQQPGLSKYAEGAQVPGVNVGGWHDAGDFDLRVESQAGEAYILALAYEQFHPDIDVTAIDQQRHRVEIHEPDGKNDILQQVENGALTVVRAYQALGRLYRGIICNSLRQYAMLGDAAAMTDGVAGNSDDRWIFTEDNPMRALSTAAQLAGAARVLRGYNDALSQECLDIAQEIYRNTEGGGFLVGTKLQVAVELYLATGAQDYLEFILSQQQFITNSIARTGWFTARIAKLLESKKDKRSRQFVDAFCAALVNYKSQLEKQSAETPYGVPYRPSIWGAGWDIQRFGFEYYFLLSAYPGLFPKDIIYNALDFILGCHPGSNTASFASGIGARSATVAYGLNRADWSYIPGGVVSGTALIRPDFPELLEFPFLWQQTEYVLGGGSSHYMFLVLAANQ